LEYFVVIAGVGFRIRTSDLLLPVNTCPQAVYRQFVFFDQHHPIIKTIHIDIKITSEPLPDTSSFKQVFEGNGSWIAYIHSGRYYIASLIPPSRDPVWIAEINNDESRVHIFCSPEIIERKSDNKKHRLLANPFSYPLDQILMMRYLAGREGGICHSAGWVINGQGLIFAGRSGAGKSTLSKILDYIENTFPLSDDRMIIRKKNDSYKIYGTPWAGEEEIAENQSAPLAALFFLHQKDENKITKLSPSEAVSQLMPVVSIPWYDKTRVEQMMAFYDDMLTHIPAYNLSFRPDASAADCLKRFIREKESIE